MALTEREDTDQDVVDLNPTGGVNPEDVKKYKSAEN
jgi:hypothetical protein